MKTEQPINVGNPPDAPIHIKKGIEITTKLEQAADVARAKRGLMWRDAVQQAFEIWSSDVIGEISAESTTAASTVSLIERAWRYYKTVDKKRSQADTKLPPPGYIPGTAGQEELWTEIVAAMNRYPGRVYKFLEYLQEELRGQGSESQKSVVNAQKTHRR